MACVRFLSDYRGVLTNERFYGAGASDDLPREAARTLARRGIVRLEPPAAAVRVEVRRSGGSWYEITVDGEVVDKVQGKEAADRRAAEVAA